MELIQASNFTYYYPENNKPSLDRVNLTLSEGEFIFLTGPSGGGKSSFLRAMAGLLIDYCGGSFGGEIRYRGLSLQKWNKRQLAREIGFIFQNPEQQLLMTMVEQEVAFGLENLGVPPAEMRRRVAESLTLFGLSSRRQEALFNLSGGEKQKVVLAAILAMHPRVLLLDEPTSQLDPVAAQELLLFIHRLNQEWGITVVLVEQRVDRCFHLADRVVLMEEGKAVFQSSPREMIQKKGGLYKYFIPPVAQVFTGLKLSHPPLTIKEGRQFLKNKAENLVSSEISHQPALENSKNPQKEEPLLQLRNLEFAYQDSQPCLRDINLSLPAESMTTVLGENGAGKSTLLKNINGLLSPQQGNIKLKEKHITSTSVEERASHIGYLSQYPEDYLFNDTVEEEIAFGLKNRKLPWKKRVEEILELLDLDPLKEKNPRDLSGGEKQRVALGVVLAPNPEVLLLDEPTRGLDMKLKHQLGILLQNLKKSGKSILMVTHDVEFAAELSCRVVIMSNGEIVAEGEKSRVLSSSLFYSPQVNRMFKDICSEIMTVDEALEKINMLEAEVK